MLLQLFLLLLAAVDAALAAVFDAFAVVVAAFAAVTPAFAAVVVAALRAVVVWPVSIFCQCWKPDKSENPFKIATKSYSGKIL